MNIEELIKLSKIFKEGFTVECKGHNLKQYTNYKKPYIVSYQTIIEIHKHGINYLNMDKLPINCIIGGWHDSETNIYYIEINKSYKHKDTAIYYAKLYNQKAIYDIRTGETTEV